tara:strand:+ start:166 stop:420 length:255 start_codon:yes stop_codon:yes gene_type:complete
MNRLNDEIAFLRSLGETRRIVQKMEAAHPWLKITDSPSDCNNFEEVAIYCQYVEHLNTLDAEGVFITRDYLRYLRAQVSTNFNK